MKIADREKKTSTKLILNILHLMLKTAIYSLKCHLQKKKIAHNKDEIKDLLNERLSIENQHFNCAKDCRFYKKKLRYVFAQSGFFFLLSYLIRFMKQ